MADKTIDGLDQAGTLTGAEEFPLWQDGATKKALLSGLVTLIPPGAKGDAGDAGAAGSVWREGTGAPAQSLGVNGDFYIDGQTANVYQKSAGDYAIVCNILGAPGAAGAAGSVWRTGSAAPSNAVGVDGDFFLNGTTGDVYQRASGTYSIKCNLTGPAGGGSGGGSLPAGGTIGQFLMNTAPASGGWHTLVMSDVTDLTQVPLGLNNFIVGQTSAAAVAKTYQEVQAILNIDLEATEWDLPGNALNRTGYFSLEVPKGFTIVSVTAVVSAGSLNLAINNNGTTVTGLSAIAVTTTKAKSSATAGDVVAAESAWGYTISGVLGATDLHMTIIIKRG